MISAPFQVSPFRTISDRAIRHNVARARPVVADPHTLARYSGRYAERRVTVRDGRLFYSPARIPHRHSRP